MAPASDDDRVAMDEPSLRAELERVRGVLRTREEALALVSDHLPAIVAVIDDRGDLVLLRGAGLATLGVTSEQLNGMALADAADVVGLDEIFIKNAIHAATTHTPVVFDTELNGRDWVIRFHPFEIRPGEWWLTGLGVDDTDRVRAARQTEAALEQQQAAIDEAAALARARDEFSMVVSHELRTPLTAITGFTSLLQSTVEDPQSRDWLVRLGRNVDDVARMVDSLLHLTEVSPVGQSSAGPVALGAVVDRTLASMEDSLEGNVVEVDIDPGLRADVDEDVLSRIVAHLVVNAVRHGGGTRVGVSARRVDDGITVAVRDHGSGVPPELREVVFEPFSRGGTPHPGNRGIGTGLAIVAKYAALLGGSVVVDDPADGGPGAEFIVTLRA